MESKELSGVVLTHGERDPKVLVSRLAEICHQVIILNDSRYGHLDATKAKTDHNCSTEIINRPFDTFPQQRNAGIERALGSWVLSMDSDELVTDSLIETVQNLQPSDDTDAYLLPRDEHFMGKKMKVANPYGALHPRLFRSNLRYAAEPLVHEQLEGLEDAQTDILDTAIFQHHPSENILEQLKKAYQYGQINDQSFSWLKIASTIPNFVIRREFWKDGMEGFLLAGVQASFRLGTRNKKD